MSHWENHRDKCKKTLLEYVPVNLTGTEKERKEMFKMRSHFILSLSLNMKDEMVEVVFKDGKNGKIENGTEFHKEVSAIIRKKGVFNTHGYFYAIYDGEKGLMINIKRIQPPTLYKHHKEFMSKYK